MKLRNEGNDNLHQIARDTQLLTTLLGISIEEAWEKHTDQSVRDQYSLDDIMAALEE